ARKVNCIFRIDEPSKNPKKQPWADNERDRTHALERALQFALFAFADAMSHHALRGWHGNIPKRNDWNRSQQPCSRFGQAGDKHSARTKKLADIKSPFFAETFHHYAGQSAGNRGGNDSDNHERQSDHSLAPAVAINRVKRPNAKHIVREIGQKLDRGQPPKFVMRAQQRKRADRVRTPQLELFSLILRQGFRNEEVTPEPIR